MTKTAKKCCIFFICSAWLLVCRIIVSNITLSDNFSDWLFTFLEQIVGMGILPLLLFKFWVKEDVLTGLSVKSKKKIPGYLWGVFIVVGLLTAFVARGVSIVWQTAIRFLGYTHVNSVGVIYSDWGVLVMDIIVTACLPALFEELTDRGLLSSALGKMDDATKMVVMAFFFALAHQNIVQTGYTYVAGLVFSYLLIKTGSIFPGVIVHFINNFLSVVGNYSDQVGGLYGKLTEMYYAFINNFFFLALLLWIAGGVALYFLLRQVGRAMEVDKKEQEPPEPETEKRAWYEYAFLYGAAAMMILSTAFTMLWGIWR